MKLIVYLFILFCAALMFGRIAVQYLLPAYAAWTLIKMIGGYMSDKAEEEKEEKRERKRERRRLKADRELMRLAHEQEMERMALERGSIPPG